MPTNKQLETTRYYYEYYHQVLSDLHDAEERILQSSPSIGEVKIKSYLSSDSTYQKAVALTELKEYKWVRLIDDVIIYYRIIDPKKSLLIKRVYTDDYKMSPTDFNSFRKITDRTRQRWFQEVVEYTTKIAIKRGMI
jgi:ERCC4-type nuclease